MLGYCYLTPEWDISFLHTMLGYCYLTQEWDISFLHTMLGYCCLTLEWDNSFQHPCCTCANVILPYQTTTTVQLNKLPLTTIIWQSLVY